MYWSYVTGMLTNLSSLSLERIYGMLKMFAMAGDSSVQCSLDDVKKFLQGKVLDGELIYTGGMYKLPPKSSWKVFVGEKVFDVCCRMLEKLVRCYCIKKHWKPFWISWLFMKFAVNILQFFWRRTPTHLFYEVVNINKSNWTKWIYYEPPNKKIDQLEIWKNVELRTQKLSFFIMFVCH